MTDRAGDLPYVELHARSAFSFLRGASLPEELAGACAALDMPAMALTDRDGVYGSPRFHFAAKKAGIRAHVGAEVTATDGTVYPLLVRNRTGYQNLCRLITRMKLRAKKYEGAARPEEIAEYAEGLVCLTGGADGPLAKAIQAGKGRECLERLVAAFGRENVYAELQRHMNREEEARNQAVVELARAARIPLLATNGVCHATAAEREILDVFTAIRNKVTLETAGRLLTGNAERYLKPAAEMARLFADLPEAIANTAELSSRLEFELTDLGYEFPKYPVPPGETMDSFLRKLTEEGARQRYRPYHERARRQIERELALIEKLKLSGYFLIVWDIVRFCREQGILVQGRGSAANSAVCYSLGITAVDPVGMDLLFERFLSEERGEWPDIDLDLPSGSQRERVIQYVYERYGRLGAAMTANVITYRGRSAAREVGKALGFEEGVLARLSSLVRAWEWKDPADTSERQFRDAGLDITHPRIRKFLELYRAVQDLPRHLGQHSGGMVICQGQLDSVVPLEPATMPGRVVVQWDKDDCADLGLIKVDLLGLGMMAVLEDTLKLIRETTGEEVDLAHLPPDDPATYRALQEADTIGMFQVESRAQQATLPRLRPAKFYDLVVQVGIIRPGPIVGKMIHPYIKRRQGREPPECLHPSLEPVLKRTLGVPIFQEQLLRIAMIAAGFTGGEAEELRRAFSHKRSEAKMREIEVRLRSGMERNGITGETQDTIVQAITSFALYGFPESHAASFALLAYASAYLKCHYLGPFTAALLNNQPMGFYHPSTIIKDAQRHGLRVLPVDVTRSEWLCTIESGCLRLGLLYVRGLREEAGRAIVEERKRRPFTDIDDLVRRVPGLRKDELTTLAQVGALNKLERSDRRGALWESSRAIQPAGPLLEALKGDGSSPLARMTDFERLDADYRGTGVTIGKHPMAFRREEMRARGVSTAMELRRMPNGRAVRVAGSVIVRQRPATANGFVFLSLEDETGIANVIVTPNVFEANRLVLVNAPFLYVEGILQNVDGVVSVKASVVEALAAPQPISVSHDFH
ncbi:MAG TPA: error-prone DNA polymerase [Bryobacteraceae bacterium]|nr:error-prone DNA polymerase [Bryobacteraceae bacterium]HOQ45595.1 error-prone DNA polymerase [Bryobacteraceae bacterium]HPQ14939.1 error-prone DNA polymerase [Bryobacteraceae bacterium]HPU72772.1 error-prone DNA polymerase [Bryobacteraceae bacterium]